jgi:hypothetical protein
VETLNNHVNIDQLHSRLLNLGLMLNVLAPGMLLALGAFIKSKGVCLNAGSNLRFIFWGLIIVAIGDIPIIYLVKRSSLLSREAFHENHPQVRVEQLLFQWCILTFSLSLSPSIYGLVYYLIGGAFERFVLFVAITLLCFMLFKPKENEIRSFVEERTEPM